MGLQVSCFVFLPLHLVLGSLAAGKEEKLTIRSSIIFLFGLLRMDECVCVCVNVFVSSPNDTDIDRLWIGTDCNGL